MNKILLIVTDKQIFGPISSVPFWFLANLLHHTISSSQHYYRPQDRHAIQIYQLSVTTCFLLSTTYHTVSDHSPSLHKRGNELDHLGIFLVLWGTGVSNTHFAFSCFPTALQNTYHTLLTLTAILCALFTLRPAFRHPTYRTARFLMYCFLGTSLFVPVLHAHWKLGGALPQQRTGLSSFLGLAVINFTGAAVYAARIPERWYPRRFDLLGQSHNWMHVFVLAGALVRFYGLLEAAEYWAAWTLEHGDLC